MGLDCSHGAFNGAYSSFNRFRKFIVAATGGSWPPHAPGFALSDNMYRVGATEDDADYAREDWPGLYELLDHSDCDGEIAPEMCTKVADDLERLMPAFEDLEHRTEPAGGHLQHTGYVGAIRKFIAGCRLAAASDEPLEFR